MTLSDHIKNIYNSPAGHSVPGKLVRFERGDNFLRISPLSNSPYSDIVYVAYTTLIVIAPGYFNLKYETGGVTIYWGIQSQATTQLPGVRHYDATQTAMMGGLFNE